MQCLHNLLLNTDSYKASHWLQYPPGTDATFFYVESRGGLYERTLFYGLQVSSPPTASRSTRPAGATSPGGMAGTCRSASAPCPKAPSFRRTGPW